MKCLLSSENRNCINIFSVQESKGYPSDQILDHPEIKVIGVENLEKNKLFIAILL